MIYVTTQPLAKAATYNLVTLDAVKSDLEFKAYDTTQDVWLGKAIRQASAAAQAYCNRNFAVEAWQDMIYFDRGPQPRMLPGHDLSVQLSSWPIVSVTAVSALTGPQTSTTLTLGTDFAVDMDVGQLFKLSPAYGTIQRWTVPQLTASFVAGYGSIATENYVLSGTSPVAVSNAAAFSYDQGVTVLNSAALSLTKGTPAAGQYAVNTTNGAYSFAAADAGKVVSVSYAFNIIPDDVVEAVLRMVTMRFKQKGRDPLLMERNTPTLGTQRFWVGAAAGQNGALPPEIEALLSNYRVPVTA